ncbi:hypothetical protein EYC84_005325 [Monilinia fructicola]|uniref:Uncharacterized protein n=1 Tax=Monilinia fructicola TaxID=38448 RepID=A0A5M9JZ31_MONFR|nr:hypothetical protein EYC84_005325 [Monilinia fructicola]
MHTRDTPQSKSPACTHPHQPVPRTSEQHARSAKRRVGCDDAKGKYTPRIRSPRLHHPQITIRWRDSTMQGTRLAGAGGGGGNVTPCLQPYGVFGIYFFGRRWGRGRGLA